MAAYLGTNYHMGVITCITSRGVTEITIEGTYHGTAHKMVKTLLISLEALLGETHLSQERNRAIAHLVMLIDALLEDTGERTRRYHDTNQKFWGLVQRAEEYMREQLRIQTAFGLEGHQALLAVADDFGHAYFHGEWRQNLPLFVTHPLSA